MVINKPCIKLSHILFLVLLTHFGCTAVRQRSTRTIPNNGKVVFEKTGVISDWQGFEKSQTYNHEKTSRTCIDPYGLWL